MNVKLILQNNGENLIKDSLVKASEAKPKKVQFFIGNIKDAGFELFEDCLIDLKARKQFVIGIDRKNTTKLMLQTLLKYTKNVYIFNNNNISEFDSNIHIFEYEDRAEIYQICGNISEGGLKDNISPYTLVSFDLTISKDKTLYEEYIKNINEVLKLEECKKLDKEYINVLVENKEIFTNKQYTHNVMTISELVGSSKHSSSSIKQEEKTSDVEVELVKEENVFEEGTLPKVDLSAVEDFGIEIDITDSVAKEEELNKKASKVDSVEKEKKKKEIKSNKKTTIENVKEENEKEDLQNEFNEEDVLDLESLILERADIELDQRSIAKKSAKVKKENKKEKAVSKKIDLNNVTNFIMELPKKPTKGRDVNCIKVSNYIKDLIPNFFEALEKGKNVEKEDGTYKEAKISIEIVDVKTNEKFSDKSAVIFAKAGQTYLGFASSILKDISYDENDIARIIKLAENVYHIEIVSKDVEEYKVWKKLCTKSFRGADRSYGLM